MVSRRITKFSKSPDSFALIKIDLEGPAYLLIKPFKFDQADRWHSSKINLPFTILSTLLTV